MSDKDTIFFAHATGFQGSMYRQFLKSFEKSFDVIFQENFGRNPDFPIVDNWANQALEVVYFLKDKKTPVIGIGHSMGGILNLLAASKKPDLFKLLILLDSPVMMGALGIFLRLSKLIGLVESMSPAKKSRKRKDRWRNRQEAMDYFQNNSFFNKFSSECLRDYCEVGLKEESGDVVLSIPVKEECSLFNSTPHNLDFMDNDGLPPIIYCQANRRVVTSQTSINRFVRKFKAKKVLIEGGHMFPMERPESSLEIMTLIKNNLPH